MRKFFKRLFKVFRPDPSGYVKNIQDGTAKDVKTSGGSAGWAKKTISDKDSFYWLPLSKVGGIVKNDQGLTTEITISHGFEFYEILYYGNPLLKIKKQGLSKINYHLELNLEKDEKLALAAGEFLAEKKNITILHINRYGDGFLYGESKGLAIQGYESGTLILEGVEDSVFNEISRECVRSLIPTKE